MELSERVEEILQKAFAYAQEKGLEYITPEIILLMLCGDEIFRAAFAECGGAAEELAEDLEAYVGAYQETGFKKEPELSAGMNLAFTYAAQSAANSGNAVLDVRHIVFGIGQLKDSFAVYYMEKQEVWLTDLLGELTALESDQDWERDLADGNKAGLDGAGRNRAGDYEEEEDEDSEELNWEPGEDIEDIEDVEDGIFRGGYRRRGQGRSARGSWQRYAPCLNDTLPNTNPLIGREDELERTIQILCRKEKNNPLHLGEPGVGKTAITYGLVQRINEKKVPEPLSGSRVFALDLGGMLAGTQYRGDFEKRFKKVLEGIGKEEKPIIYIDEIHNLSGSGAVGESSFDAANLLKPYLVSGHIRFIGATTFEEYKKYFERNKSLARRFQTVEIKEPSEAEAVEILKGLQEKYEEFHGVLYKEGVLEYAVSMSAKHINERFLPDKAIDLMDEAGAYRKLHPYAAGEVDAGQQTTDQLGDGHSTGLIEAEQQSPVDQVAKEQEAGSLAVAASAADHAVDREINRIVDKEVINYVLTKICRVPLETVKTDEADGLSTLEERMKGRVFGQDEAVSQVVNAIKFSRAGLLEEGKPLASLLFVGPTGVGKTEIARSLAEEMGVKLIRFDMSEYEEKHAVAKLIGAPAGYVGYEEGGLLTEAVRKSPFAVLLLDEIEKAHADIYNVLLQVMDYATLTDNQGRKADFRNVVLIMTSNAGANRIGKKGIGFESAAENAGVLMEEVKRTFQPEFRNRLNRIVIFHGMDDTMAVRVIEKKMNELKDMLKKREIELQVDESALALIKEKGVSEEFGAREIDRVIRNEVKPLLVDDILFGALKQGGTVLFTGKEGQFALELQ